jgi:RsiW-degrading membrane proteinase PrsW (M82 family)
MNFSLNNTIKCLTPDNCRQWCMEQSHNYKVSKIYLVLIAIALIFFGLCFPYLKLKFISYKPETRQWIIESMFITALIFLTTFILINLK